MPFVRFEPWPQGPVRFLYHVWKFHVDAAPMQNDAGNVAQDEAMIPGPFVPEPVRPVLNVPNRWKGLPTQRSPSPRVTCAWLCDSSHTPSLFVGMLVAART